VSVDAIMNAENAEGLPVIGMRAGDYRHGAIFFDQWRGIRR
jgi:hypothetical protein